MRFGFKQPLVGEKRCVTTLITAAKETTKSINLGASWPQGFFSKVEPWGVLVFCLKMAQI